MKNRYYYKHISRAFISVLLIAYLTFKVNWSQIINVLQSAHLGLYVLSTLVAMIGPIFIAAKYFLLIKDSPIRLPISSIVKINFVSRYYALFIPTAVGTEVVRWYKITKNRGGRIFFFTATVYERLIHVLLLLLFGLVPLLFYTANARIEHLRSQLLPVITVLILLNIIGLAYFLVPHFESALRALATRLVPPGGRWSDLRSALEDLSTLDRSISFLASIVVLNLMWNLVFFGRLYFIFRSLSLNLGFMEVVWMSSLVILLQLIPITYAGLGIREGAYAYLMTVFNYAPEKGVLIGLLFFSQMLIISLIGGVIAFFEVKGPAERAAGG